MALLSIVRSFYCHRNVQRFAVDAIRHVQTAQGQQLSRWLLRHYRLYLLGASDPERRFQDYQNQVIHASQGYWGGAPRVAHQWYDRWLSHLQNGWFPHAARAAGILCHYFVDPLQPLHTDASQHESVIHRPLEYCIWKHYDEILQTWITQPHPTCCQLPDGSGWLGAAMINHARIANRRFEMFVHEFELKPNAQELRLSAGLKRTLAELFGLAITGWARVIERAALDHNMRTNRSLPRSSYTLPYLFAIPGIPLATAGGILHASSMFHRTNETIMEYNQTGAVRENLPCEVDIKLRVRRVYQQDHDYRQSQSAQQHVARLSLSAALGVSSTECKAMQSIGVHDVRDLVTNQASYLASQLDVYWINVERIQHWQRQGNLRCDLPELTIGQSHMLAKAGFSRGAELRKTPAPEVIRQVAETGGSITTQELSRLGLATDISRDGNHSVRHAA